MAEARMRHSRIVVALASVALPLGVVAGLGCNSILGFGSYTFSDGGDAGATAEASSDARFDGSPDGAEAACPVPTDRAQFESACTTAQCEPFDDSRLPLDGGLRPLPSPPPPDAGPDGQGGEDGATAADAATDEAGAPDAGGPVPCASLSNPVYATGSSALVLFLGTVGTALFSSGITFVYQTSASCIGVQSVLQPGFVMTGTATYYDASGSAITCALPAGGQPVDIGVSDVFATTCQQLPNGLPGNVKENLGPVQTMVFTVPTTSQQNSISLVAAYDVFGFGAESMVSPWTDASQIFQRNSSSGTQNMLAAAIGVPAAQWMGVVHASSGAMVTDLQTAGKDPTTANQTIGVLSIDYVQENPATLRPLAFQDDGKSCGYFPDSTSTANDKANVRDGHYPLWGPSHFFNFVDAQGAPINANAQAFIDALSGISPLQGVDLLQLYATHHVVPLCAMHVQRSSDGADYGAFTPPSTCNCYFDLQATGQTACKTCTSSSGCPASTPTCSQFGNPPVGYCELQ
jgi:hypothetical protein